MNITQALRSPPSTGRLQRFKDDKQPGLYLRISKGGKAAYIVRTRGSTSDRKIGEPESMTLAQARAAAATLRPALRFAEPPVFEQDFTARVAPSRSGRVAPSRDVEGAALQDNGPTVAEAWTTYLEICQRRVARGRMAAKTFKGNRNWYRNNIEPTLGNLPMQTVTRHDVERAVSGCNPATHNRVLNVISAFFNTMQREHGIREGLQNPVRGVERDREQWRKRTLTARELQVLSASLERWQGQEPCVVGLVRFLLSTPRRIGEALKLQWADVDLVKGIALFRDTKTGDDQLHALSPQAVATLHRLPRTSDWVFPSVAPQAARRAAAAVSETHVRKTFKAILADAGIPAGQKGNGVTLHDLRRTVATWAAEGGATPHQLRAMLGHKTTAMADRYVGHVDERAPVSAASDAIERAMQGK